MGKKTASSQAAWALLTEGVTRSRLEVHRIQLMVQRIMALVDDSEKKEHIYQVAGDVIEGMPKRLQSLEIALDRTSLALSKMGEEFFESRLPLSEKALVDEAVEAAFGASQPKHSASARRVAERYMRADLSPPLGKPSGPCKVVRRIDMQVRNPSVKLNLIEDVETGEGLDNAEASEVYGGPDIEFLGGMFRKIQLSAHAQYRMDLRGITVAMIQKSLLDLSNQAEHDPMLFREIMGSRNYKWSDPKRGITIVFEPFGREAAKVITVYLTTAPDPKPPGEGGCR